MPESTDTRSRENLFASVRYLVASLSNSFVIRNQHKGVLRTLSIIYDGAFCENR